MRDRVTQRLKRAAQFPIALVAAPAGFGKTVALRHYLETYDPQAVRYTVRREDATLLAFVRGLSEALQAVAPSALAAYPAMQQRVLAAEEPVRQLSDWFAEHLKGVSCTIAVDDLHFAGADPASIALLADLIERTCERIKWIVASRSDMGLPVATWIAYGRMDLPVGEDDLRFTTAEALAAAEEARSGGEPDEIEALRQLTEGWAVALTISLRTRTHAQDLRTASLGTREMVYRYLAEQVFAGLDEAQRRFALATSVFSNFDGAIAHRLGATPEFLAELRRNLAFLTEFAPAEFRYHDLFRDFLETELRRCGSERWLAALRDGGRILAERGELGAALLLYAKAQASAEILEILAREGLSLFERGEGDALAAALRALPEQTRAATPAALGVDAMLEAGRGHFEIAQRSFEAAIALASEPRQRAQLVLRYAIELVRQNRDCTQLLEPYARDETLPPEERAPILGTLATGYARAGKVPEAVRAITGALEALAGAPDAIRARVFHQAAYVYQFVPDLEKAERYAGLAVDLALQRNLYELAARAYSILYTVRYESDDAAGSIAMLERLVEAAVKAAAHQARLFGLMALYELQTERADEGALQNLDNAIRATHATFTLARAEALVPAQAMRAAWSGDFRKAYELRAGTTREPASPERRALRSAETAFYAVAAGLSDEAEAHYRDAASALEETPGTTLRTTLASVFLSITDIVRGHHAAAHRTLTQIETRSSDFPRVRAFAAAARVLYRVHLGQADESAMRAVLERLTAAQFGGAARLLDALPPGQAGSGGYMQLTPAEREILQSLARGASTKDIANRTGRSAHTVDTHIRAICRKLQCSGRREAVALAVGAGWVQATE